MGTLKQANKLLKMFEDMPAERMETLLASGFLAVLRDADISKMHIDEFRRACGWRLVQLPPLFEYLGPLTVTLEHDKDFIVREKFGIKTGAMFGVQIGWVSDNFYQWFGSKIETPPEESKLHCARLTRHASDEEILKEIDSECAEASLAEIYGVMERQPKGKPGILLTSGVANIFYARDVDGCPRSVIVYWDTYASFWSIGACDLKSSFGWYADCQIFFHNY